MVLAEKRMTKTKTCPCCDGSGTMPGAMRAVIFPRKDTESGGCWVCYGSGTIPHDQDVAPLWTLHKASEP